MSFVPKSALNERTFLFLSFSIVLLFPGSHVKSMPQYFGDISLGEYLIRYFSNSKTSNHLFLIDYTSPANRQTTINEFLHQHHIHYTHLASFSNLSVFEALFADKLNIQSIYVIVDCRSSQTLSKVQLTIAFTRLSAFYQRCNKCHPLIVLLSNTSTSVIESAVRNLPESFQLVILINGSTVIHVNAVVKGCTRSSGVLEPKTKADWQQLKMDVKRCDLNGTLLNVSVNHVRYFSVQCSELLKKTH